MQTEHKIAQVPAPGTQGIKAMQYRVTYGPLWSDKGPSTGLKGKRAEECRLSPGALALGPSHGGGDAARGKARRQSQVGLVTASS